MEKIIARCGLNCSECPAFIATKNNDIEGKRKVAESWSKMFNADIKAEDINCQGCMATGDNIFNYCKTCEIRKCAQASSVNNCAQCVSYGCEKITKFHDMAPDAKKNLEDIRKDQVV